jgi:site-specific DNA-methyltransferase (adenine-specific)
MDPYYSDELVTIYHGDCRDVLPTLAVDAVVTDPPYGTGYYVTDKAILTGELMASWVEQYRTVMVFGYPERLVGLCVAAEVVPVEWVTWWPTNGAVRGTNLSGLWKETECVAAFGEHVFEDLRVERESGSFRHDVKRWADDNSHKRRGTSHGNPETRRCPDVWRDASPNLGFNIKRRNHPNEKPVTVMARLLEATPPGVVADPFMGSGSTLVAARQLGRRCIGIEVEERYCEVAVRRLDQQTLALVGD